MFYNSKEFLYLKPKKSYLQRFKVTNNKPKVTTLTPRNQRAGVAGAAGARTRNISLMTFLKQYLMEYFRTSSIHCFHYLSNNKLRCYEKYFFFNLK